MSSILANRPKISASNTLIHTCSTLASDHCHSHSFIDGLVTSHWPFKLSHFPYVTLPSSWMSPIDDLKSTQATFFHIVRCKENLTADDKILLMTVIVTHLHYAQHKTSSFWITWQLWKIYIILTTTSVIMSDVQVSLQVSLTSDYLNY